MKLTITAYANHYVVTDESGLTLRILTKKALVWNLKHAFGFKSEKLKQIGQELKDKGVYKVAV